LERAHPAISVETRLIKTSGDIFLDASLTRGAGKGIFTKEIEDQLLRGDIHLAVHSMKDLPTLLPDGLTIGAVPAREDARDVFIAKRGAGIDDLPRGARVATSSVRRRAQLLARRPDLQIEEIRGNVETRLRKLCENDALDALILAAAGLKRLGLLDTLTGLRWQPLALDVMIPAVGQGAIACEVRETDFETQELLTPLNDSATLACCEAERSFLRTLGGGCQMPYAAHARVAGKQMRLIGATFNPDGTGMKRVDVAGLTDDPRELGERAAQQVRP
jgi:hydroxymethylbilane synthase